VCPHQVSEFFPFTTVLLTITQELKTSLAAALSSPKVIESLAKAVKFISIGEERAACEEEEDDAHDGDNELPTAKKRKPRTKTALEKEIHVSW
jgi:hypothetical protein